MQDALPRSRLAFTVAAAFSNSVAIGLANLGLVFLVKDAYGADPATIGGFGAAWSLSYFVACFLLAPVTRRLRPRVSLSASSILCALSTLGAVLAPGVVPAFAFNIVYGASIALFWPPLMGWFSEGLEGPGLSRATGAFSIAWSAGTVIAPWLAGALAESYGASAPVIAGASLFFIDALAIGATLVARPDPAPGPVPGAEFAPRARRDEGTALRFPAWIGVFAAYAFSGLVMNIFPGYAQDELGFSKDAVGLLLLLRAATSTAGFLLFGRFHFWHFRRRWIALTGAALTVLAFALSWASYTALAPAFWIASAAVLGMLYASAYNASIFYGVSGASDRASRMKIHEAMLTAGQVSGSVLGGIAYGASSIGVALVAVGGLLSAAFLAQLPVLLSARHRSGPTNP